LSLEDWWKLLRKTHLRAEGGKWSLAGEQDPTLPRMMADDSGFQVEGMDCPYPGEVWDCGDL
jgi:hypothetical protein